MSRVYNQDKPKAVWTLIHEAVSASGVKRCVYFSDGGGVKITRHTDQGERFVASFPGGTLTDLAELTNDETLTKLAQAMADVKQENQKKAIALQAQAKAAKLVERAQAEIQAARDRLAAQGFKPEEIDKLMGKQSA